MPLADLVTRIKDHTSSNVSKLETRLAAAIEEATGKRATLDALLAADKGDAQVMAAEDAASSADRRVLSLRSALATAQRKQADEQDEAAREFRRSHAKKIFQAAEARHTAAISLAKSSKLFAADYRALLQANASLAGLLAPDRDTVGDATDRPTLETMLRRNLAKDGLAWAFPCPFGTVDIPELVPQLGAALDVVLRGIQKDL